MEELRRYYESRGYYVEYVQQGKTVKINGVSYSPEYLKSIGGIIPTEGEHKDRWMIPSTNIGFALESPTEINYMVSDAVNKIYGIKRFEFELNGESYSFILNPEEYSQSEPNRLTVTQTKGGLFVDEFGAGVKDISFSGTTGFSSGFAKFKELRDLILKSYELRSGEYISTAELFFYNYTDEQYFKVAVESFTLRRSKNRPLLYQYEVKLICLSDLSNPAQLEDSMNQIGNSLLAPDTRVSYGQKNNIPKSWWTTGSISTSEYGEIILDSNGNIVGRAE